MHEAIDYHYLPQRFGSGLTLQARVEFEGPSKEQVLFRATPKQFLFQQRHRSHNRTPNVEDEVHSKLVC